MFRLLDDSAVDFIEIELDGAPACVPSGITAAAALLYLDRLPTRLTPVNQQPRAPYCMIGNCYDCLLEIDGVRNERGCQVEVRSGMSIRRQLDAPGSGPR